MSLIISILVFGLIILIHEFGHFIVAKKNGIAVVEFSIGMGPRLLTTVRGETRYSIKAFPFGGSCMMLGEDESDPDPRAFNNKPVWSRIAVVAAGPVFNFLLAFVLAVIIVGYVGYDSPELTGVQEGFSAQEQGMQAGDVITKLDNTPVVIYRDLTMFMLTHTDAPIRVEYRRTLEDGSVEKRTAVLTPKLSEETGTYMLGIITRGYRVPAGGVLNTLKYGAYEVVYWIKAVIKSIGMMIGGQVHSEDLAGPIRMVAMVDETVDESISYGIVTMLLSVANLCVLFSANLGVMNLLPIPALDGGRLVFMLIEAVRGKPVDREKEGLVHLIGMALLMCLMIFVLFNDISNVFFH